MSKKTNTNKKPKDKNVFGGRKSLLNGHPVKVTINLDREREILFDHGALYRYAELYGKKFSDIEYIRAKIDTIDVQSLHELLYACLNSKDRALSFEMYLKYLSESGYSFDELQSIVIMTLYTSPVILGGTGYKSLKKLYSELEPLSQFIDDSNGIGTINLFLKNFLTPEETQRTIQSAIKLSQSIDKLRENMLNDENIFGGSPSDTLDDIVNGDVFKNINDILGTDFNIEKATSIDDLKRKIVSVFSSIDGNVD